jgi:hypothetical protein
MPNFLARARKLVEPPAYVLAMFSRNSGDRGVWGGRPILRPFDRAFRMPAFTRSWMRARSNSAIAPIIRNIRRPDGVVRSRLSRRLTKSIPSDSNSARELTKWRRDRPNRSSFQTRTTSNCRRRAAVISLFSSGRCSFEPDTPTSTYSPATAHPRRSQYSRSSRVCMVGS